jgi:SAM-dependent methyltransferase
VTGSGFGALAALMGACVVLNPLLRQGTAGATVADAQPGIFGESAAYERFMGRWSRLLAPALVTFAGVRDGDDVLDVGSGTGALSEAVARAAPTARILGIDPSAAYIAYAQSKTASERVRFMVGDAQRLESKDATFDRVLSLLVVNFIPDAARAVREMRRVTRPGGVVAAAVWDYDSGMQMLRVFWDEAVAMDPAIASRDERHMPLTRRGQLGALWREQGLVDVEEAALSIGMTFPSFDDYWTPFLGGQGPAGAYVKGLGESQREALKGRLRQRLLQGGPDRSFTLEGRAWAVKGSVERRPTR